MRGFAGPKRGLDRRQLLVAVMDYLLRGLRWREVSFEYIAAIKLGCFLLRPGIDCQSKGTLLHAQFDPISDAQLCCPSHELLQSPLGVGAWMVYEVLVLFGDMRLERGQFCVPGVPDLLGPHRITPEHVSEALIREHLDHLLVEEVQLKRPLAQQLFNLGFRDSGNV